MNSAQQLGDTLRRAREALALSLDDVERATSIRTSILAAFEEGRSLGHSMAVYNRAFLQQYARYLRIEPELLMQQYPDLFAIQKQDVDFSVGMCTMEVRGAPRPRFKQGSWMLLLVVAAAVVAFFIFV